MIKISGRERQVRRKAQQQTIGAQEEWSLKEWKNGSEAGQLAKDPESRL